MNEMNPNHQRTFQRKPDVAHPKWIMMMGGERICLPIARHTSAQQAAMSASDYRAGYNERRPLTGLSGRPIYIILLAAPHAMWSARWNQLAIAIYGLLWLHWWDRLWLDIHPGWKPEIINILFETIVLNSLRLVLQKVVFERYSVV